MIGENQRGNNLPDAVFQHQDELEIIISTYGTKLKLLAYKFVRDWHVVDDLLQEVYLKVFLNIKNIDHIKSIKSWLYTITSNQCLDYLRQKYVKNTILIDNFEMMNTPSMDSVEIEILRKSNQEYLLTIINTLPKNYKEPFYLYYFCQFSYKEIGLILKISIQNLKTRIHRAKKMVKEKYLSIQFQF